MLYDRLAVSLQDHDRSAALLDAVSALDQPSVLAALLESICRDPAMIAAGAARSFRHPLGFNKLTLIDALPMFMLRVHAWWPNESTCVDHVHNHRFEFASTVVRGEYRMDLYRQESSGIPVTEYCEQVNPEFGWRLSHVGSAHLRPLAAFRLSEGTAYTLPSDALHRVTVSRQTSCVTLFLQGTISRNATQVFVDPHAPLPRRTPKKALTAATYRCELGNVLDELARSSAPILASP